MDIATIAMTAITAMTPFLAKGGEKIAEGVGKDLWELIKKPFKSDREQGLLKQLEDTPDDPIVQGKTIGKFEELLESNPEVAEELAELLKQLPEAGKGNTQTVIGSNNTVMQGVSGSMININKDK